MEKDIFFNVADIVKRAKRVLNFKTDADLAAYLGVSRSTLSNWIAPVSYTHLTLPTILLV